MLYEGFGVNGDGVLTVGDCDVVSLAEKFGTPLYVMNEDKLRETCRRYKQAFEGYGKGKVLYASKALNCKTMCRIVHEEGLCLDVVSGGELYTALAAGVPASSIYFHGNNKTPDEIRLGIDSDIGCFVADNLPELSSISRLAREAGKTISVSLRIKPGVDAHTHDFIRTGQVDSKFGFALETGEAMAAAVKAAELPNLRLKGIHCHIGSQIFETEPFQIAVERMCGLMGEIREKLGIVLEELNMGGGFGIKYTYQDKPLGVEIYVKNITDAVIVNCDRLGLAHPTVLIEPGRSIVGDSGITLYTVGAVKEIPGIRTYVSVDGGMGDNPRYALYGAKYTVVIANKASQPADATVTVAGRCCESGDLIGENMMIQQPEPGDIMAVFSTGAYNYSMASNYNRIPRPALVMVRGGTPYVAIRRETYEDLIHLDV